MEEIRRDDYLNWLIRKKGIGLIKVIAGLRRCGKSYLLFTIYYRYLISQGVPDDHIIRFSFDVQEDLDKLDAYLPSESTYVKAERGKPDKVNSKKFRAYIADRINDEDEYYLLLDEIQNLDNFVGTLNGFLRNECLDVYVTGSNSRFLSRNILTDFRGRGDQIHIYPLTFKEYYDYRGIPFKEAYNEYSYYGGMPLVQKFRDVNDKSNYLKRLYEETYLKDLLERNGISDGEALNKLLDILASAIGSYTNSAKLERQFKSEANLTYSHPTIEKHIGFLVDSFLISKATRYDIKGQGYLKAFYKYYFTDVGLRNAKLNFRQFEPTHIMENIIYNELVSRGYNVDIGVVETYELNANNVSVRKQLEIDFVINALDKRIYVQSAYSMPNFEKIAQEKKSLLKTGDSFEKIIIVNEDIRSFRCEDGILILSLEDFLLKKSGCSI